MRLYIGICNKSPQGNSKMDIVQKVLKESAKKVYVPPTLRGYYKTKLTPYGTRLA